MNKKDILNKIQLSKTKIVKIKTNKKSGLDVKESKIGGVPYWPKSLAYPTIGIEKAKLIAQINFTKLSQQGIYLDGFPDKGILQFFAPVGDDMVGLRFNGKSKVLVKFHEDESCEGVLDKNLIEISQNDDGMPFLHESEMSFSEDEECLGIWDEIAIEKIYGVQAMDLDPEMFDILSENENSGSKIGGYAYFTQADPRMNLGFKDPVLLLQIDTDENIMWGDSGVANWFIERQDLLNKDFSKVYFTWDCC